MVEKRQQTTVNGQRELPPLTGPDALALLESVKDPEVPVLSVVELGIVRGVEVDGAGQAATITVTPTYSGCPAMQVIEEEIVAALRAGGFRAVEVRTVYAPAWTTDWISDAAREKLRAYGIAPPGQVTAEQLVPLGPVVRSVSCPFCGSPNTSLTSEFGATACKSLHVCHACRQPFEHFKAF
ncbi:MAG TPA: 1,2-phenylacetyl-CoA epoxidase subunit PaaD [Gemmatimonadales bacterium]|jgi:ring-1,2-phenylacetyl-CoA epoxidase subunit PaaD|nr:1,2-phenylacetyl-CoA epoxidase subunit PaaD [Gemmatimonadales bacterium]